MASAELPQSAAAAALTGRLVGLARRPGALWLETSHREETRQAWSYLACEPAVWIRGAGSLLEVLPGPAGDRGWLRRVTRADPGPGEAFDRLQAIAGRLRVSASTTEQRVTGDPPPFRGGFAGCFSYDLGRRFEQLPALLQPELPWDFQVGLYDEVIALCAATGEFHHYRLPGSGCHLLDRWQASQAEPEWQAGLSAGITGSLQAEMDEDAHRQAVQAIRKHICEGTIYQANLTFRCRAPSPDPQAALATFVRLRRDNPAPYAAYVDLPGTTLVSTSPENFLALHGCGRVDSRPIKGTIARGPTGSIADLGARDALLESAKDRAELAMIVDLVRNDFGRVCRPGTVNRDDTLVAEAHPSVWHLVGNVNGQLAEGRDAFDLLRACFPPGSCIGAPKLRAMAVLEELEHSRRGPYTGALGWIGLDGTMCLSVAIRTLVFRNKMVSYGVGGGIVYDSVPADEWHEALLKGKALAAALFPEAPLTRAHVGTGPAKWCP